LSRGVHIIKMETKTNIRLGRGHDSDIRITDISVSRCHAVIKLEKGSFYIEDNNSKFGTLVYVKNSIPLVGDYANLSVQIGRTVLGLTVKKNWKMLPACFSSISKNQVDTNHDNDDKDAESGDEMVFEPGVQSNSNPEVNGGIDDLNQNPNGDDDIAPEDLDNDQEDPDHDDNPDNNSHGSNHNEVVG